MFNTYDNFTLKILNEYFVKSDEPDEMAQSLTFHQGLHSLFNPFHF